MDPNVVYEGSVLISGMMCYKDCGLSLKDAIYEAFESKIKSIPAFPSDAQLILDAEPFGLGLQNISISIVSEEQTLPFDDHVKNNITAYFYEAVDDVGFTVETGGNSVDKPQRRKKNWINLFLNIAAITGIIILASVFPPSLPLTIGLTVMSFLTSAITARDYLKGFYQDIRRKMITTMSTPITLGWILSLAHTLYHAITMRFIAGVSMIFMNFVMPLTLISIVNVMDEVKQRIMQASRRMQVRGLKHLLPNMSDEYDCYEISLDVQNDIIHHLSPEHEVKLKDSEISALVLEISCDANCVKRPKKSLKSGTMVRIKRGECFPVDGFLISKTCFIDASIITGEPRQKKQRWELIRAGTMNLSEDAIIFAKAGPYDSELNQILLKANREETSNKVTKNNIFAYVYIALITISIVTAIVTPLALGVLTIPLLLQNITGILFAICPCTITIGLQLPQLLSSYQQNKHGIVLRNNRMDLQDKMFDTYIFDKTGTLTTGESEVAIAEGMNQGLWERLCLLEYRAGGEHPIAQAIERFFYQQFGKRRTDVLFNDVHAIEIDTHNRGISGIIQGKQLHVGNKQYMEEKGIATDEEQFADVVKLIKSGLTPVYVAEGDTLKAIILIKHAVRANVVDALQKLKNNNKKLILLTGDSEEAAIAFAKQIEGCSEATTKSDNQEEHMFERIYWKQTPEDKNTQLESIMNDEANPKRVCYIGDGLNDSLCARTISDKGGVSFSISSGDKASYFSNVSLNGTLDYLFYFERINRFYKNMVNQNKWLLCYSALAFLACIITCSLTGIALSPLIPSIIMASTTALVIFNSYRVPLDIDNNFVPEQANWAKKIMASNVSTGLLVVTSVCLLTSILVAAVASGGLAIPVFAFTAGVLSAVSSGFLMAAAAGVTTFLGLSLSYFLMKSYRGKLSGEVEPPIPEKTVSEASNAPVYSVANSIAEALPLAKGHYMETQPFPPTAIASQKP